MHHELGNTPNTWIPGPELPCVTHVSASGNNIAPDRFLVINGQDIDKAGSVHPRWQSWITTINIERVTDRQTKGLTDRQQTSYIFFVQERRPNCKELLVGNMAKQSFVQIQSLELKSLFSL